MLKNIIIVLISFFSFTAVISQKESIIDCKKFHEGTFQLTGKKSNITIVREGNVQTETNIKNDASFKYLIVWITDCKFKLEPLNASDQDFFKGKEFIGEITNVKENSYTCVSGFSDEKMKVTDEIIKVN